MITDWDGGLHIKSGFDYPVYVYGNPFCNIGFIFSHRQPASGETPNFMDVPPFPFSRRISLIFRIGVLSAGICFSLTCSVKGEHTPVEITQRRKEGGGLRGWPRSIGIGGRLQSEWVADLERNPQPMYQRSTVPARWATFAPYKELAKKSQDGDAIAAQLLKVLPKRSMAEWMVGYNVKSRYLGKK